MVLECDPVEFLLLLSAVWFSFDDDAFRDECCLSSTARRFFVRELPRVDPATFAFECIDGPIHIGCDAFENGYRGF